MKYIFILLLVTNIILPQSFKVLKVKGNVKYQHSTEEKLNDVKEGSILSLEDMVVTDGNAYIVLQSEESKFIIKNNSAIDLFRVKKISLNDLILSLAMEDINSLPENNSRTKSNTAVYGADVSKKDVKLKIENSLGLKKLNGAIYLSEQGFTNSAILAAKETYKKYPSTLKEIKSRLYFAKKLEELNLLNEAIEELLDIEKYCADSRSKVLIESELNRIKSKL